MLDVRLLRDSPDVIRNDLRKRGWTEKLPLVDEAVAADLEWRHSKKRVDDLRHAQNKITAEIASLKRAGKDPKDKLAEAKGIPAEIAGIEKRAAELQARVREILMSLPNILHESVPVGPDDSGNVTARTWGKPRKFDFAPKDHQDVLGALGLIDMERAAKISGARFFFLMGDALRLEQSIMRYAVDFLSDRGFTAVGPPLMMRRDAYAGVVDLADFGPVIYKVEGDDLYLIATSEHPMVAMHMDEILAGDSLPIRYCGFSPNFRVEAGAHGKDTKGIFRTHQFYKVEQVVFAKPEASWTIHEELIGNSEAIFQSLGLHYRVVNICTGDIGTVAAKKYDLEAWMPVQEKFREMVSCSNVTDYQARRLMIRYKEKQSAEPTLVHTLNSTAVTTRALVAIVENFQQKDGSIAIPEPLVPYMGGLEKIT
ncbi:MAG TPA: serine--tRNA ligase [Nitrososphaerales archaeon]|nr:serine--tRNA ligase [Nitrososphaerales archaeon]HUK75831.1 serine--tRNA ligase [Nitrososphaerales archaeon]